MADDADRAVRANADGSRLRDWFLLDANRLVVTGVLTAGVFVAFVAAVTLFPPSFAARVASSDPVDTTFSATITVVVTGTTLVVTIGQLVLTQENGPLGDQRERMRSSMAVRETTAELTGSPSPADPADFLAVLLETTARRSEALRASVDGADDALHAEVTEFVDTVVGNADAVRDHLDGARFGSFDVVSAALAFDYSRAIFEAERIEHDYRTDLGPRERTAIDDLREVLTLFGPAREHIKTLYFQWALIDLSRQILYAAVPAVAVAGITIAVVDAATFPGSTLGVEHLVLVVGGAFAVTLVPFLLFVAYILQVLTIAKLTLAIEPLILDDSEG